MENRVIRPEHLAEAEYEAQSLTNNVKLAVQEGDIVEAKAFANAAICKINEAKYFRTILSNDIYFPDTYDFVPTEMVWIKELPEASRTVPESFFPIRSFGFRIVPRDVLTGPAWVKELPEASRIKPECFLPVRSYSDPVMPRDIVAGPACIKELPEASRTVPASLPVQTDTDRVMPRDIVAGPGPLSHASVMRAQRRGTGINYLRQGASVNDRQMINRSHLHHLETNDRSEQLSRNVRVRSREKAQQNAQNYGSDIDLNVLLCQAAALSDSELIKMLLEKGADITSKNSSGKTPLHIACERNSLEIIKLLAEYSPAYILDMTDRNGRTPLDIACRCNSPDVVQYLLSQGSSVDVNVAKFEKDSKKCDPLLAVASNRKYAKQIASLVLDAGAHIDRINCNWDTLLTTAVANAAKEMQHRMRLSGNGYQSYVDLGMMLIDRGCNVNAANRSGNTALHIAVKTKQENFVRKLLICGSNIDRLNCLGHTPLVDACSMGNQRIVDLLIDWGAHLNFDLKLENGRWFSYAINKMKQCKTLKHLCIITIRKNIRNAEKDVFQLRPLPPFLVKHLLLKE